MTRWPSPNWRARAKDGVAARFSPHLWSLNDQIIAIAAIVLAVSVFLPWYRANVKIRNTALSGFLIQPRGTASGLVVHEFLWAIFGLALLQFVVPLARYARNRQPPAARWYGIVLLGTSAICFALALVAFVLKPSTWYGGNSLGGGFPLVIVQDYGAIVAVIAALASLIVAWTVLRDPATP